MSAAPVLVDVDGGTAVVTLNRPERLNALNGETVGLLVEILQRLEDDAAVRVVVLTGAGAGFSAGGDLTEGPAALLVGDTLDDRCAAFREKAGVIELLRSLPQVTVAAVNGACASAGLSLALACDLRVAASGAVFVPAFLDAGVSGDLGAIWLASRLIGPARARELFLLGGRIDSARALQMGLVSRVLPDDTFRDDVRALVAGLVDAAPLALAGMTANLRDAEDQTLPDYLDVESRRQVETMSSADAAEAAAAFFERRRPVFTGR